jgi:hypothetical protein
MVHKFSDFLLSHKFSYLVVSISAPQLEVLGAPVLPLSLVVDGKLKDGVVARGRGQGELRLMALQETLHLAQQLE